MADQLTESEIFALLASRRRRLLLGLLRGSTEPPTMIELARRVRDSEDDDAATRDLMSIQVSLYHNHLPKLEEADVVTYDENEGTVRPARNYGVLIGFLDEVGEEERPWSDE